MNSICVFCGSNSGFDEIFREDAIILGKALARERISLVYGGGNIGLMGIMADACLEENGEVIGVITQKLIDIEVAHKGLNKMHIVETMSERKLLMEKLSDAFIVLPGGYGTLDELFEMVTLNQLNIIKKPIGILNTKGYFDPLLLLIENSINEGFIKSDHRKLFAIENNAKTLIDRMTGFDHVDTKKWLDSFKKI
jgi:uncharacterized protein (TIGR00730 family)